MSTAFRTSANVPVPRLQSATSAGLEDLHVQELILLVDLSDIINLAITLPILRPLATDRAKDVPHIVVLQRSSVA